MYVCKDGSLISSDSVWYSLLIKTLLFRAGAQALYN